MTRASISPANIRLIDDANDPLYRNAIVVGEKFRRLVQLIDAVTNEAPDLSYLDDPNVELEAAMRLDAQATGVVVAAMTATWEDASQALLWLEIASAETTKLQSIPRGVYEVKATDTTIVGDPVVDSLILSDFQARPAVVRTNT